ncbi:cobalamin biosynthesis protein [Streptomyces diastatochromogenes]|nr:cobalamin biosynthesis protein [Streptomyces diastatochromogenes]
MPVPHPSALPLAATGTASVAEAAALLAAGQGPGGGAGAVLLVPKRKTRSVTCALAASVPFRPNEVAPGARLLHPTHGYIAGEPGSPPPSPPPTRRRPWTRTRTPTPTTCATTVTPRSGTRNSSIWRSTSGRTPRRTGCGDGSPTR